MSALGTTIAFVKVICTFTIISVLMSLYIDPVSAIPLFKRMRALDNKAAEG